MHIMNSAIISLFSWFLYNNIASIISNVRFVICIMFNIFCLPLFCLFYVKI